MGGSRAPVYDCCSQGRGRLGRRVLSRGVSGGVFCPPPSHLSAQLPPVSPERTAPLSHLSTQPPPVSPVHTAPPCLSCAHSPHLSHLSTLPPTVHPAPWLTCEHSPPWLTSTPCPLSHLCTQLPLLPAEQLHAGHARDVQLHAALGAPRMQGRAAAAGCRRRGAGESGGHTAGRAPRGEGGGPGASLASQAEGNGCGCTGCVGRGGKSGG